jgi:hypothetical protein
VRPTATRRTLPHPRVYLALLPSGPDAVRRLKLTRVRAAVRRTHAELFDTRQSGSVLRREAVGNVSRDYFVAVARGTLTLVNTASMNWSVVHSPVVDP